MFDVFCPKCKNRNVTFEKIFRGRDKSSTKYYTCDMCEKHFGVVETTDNYHIYRTVKKFI